MSDIENSDHIHGVEAIQPDTMDGDRLEIIEDLQSWMDNKFEQIFWSYFWFIIILDNKHMRFPVRREAYKN